MVRKTGKELQIRREFEGEAREQKKQVWRSLKLYLKTKGEEEKERLKEDRRKLEEVGKNIVKEQAEKMEESKV